MKNLIKSSILVLLMIMCFVLVGCDKEKEPEEVINSVTHSVHQIMENTVFETDVHVFESNISGPTIAIIGGTHGDEVAGWRAALKLVERNDYIGTVIIIPRANYLATQLEKRYPGVGNNGIYNGEKYEDLNRSYPGDVDGSLTKVLAYSIVHELGLYNPQYVIDLHESRDEYDTSTGKLGSSLITGNGESGLFAFDVIDIYASTKAELGEARFALDSNAPEGSLNQYMGSLNEEVIAITIETNRKLTLEKRVSQQINMVGVILELAWK